METCDIKDFDDMFSFFHAVGRLKDTYRFSANKFLRDKESSADHSWRLSLMAFVVAEELKLDIDVNRAVRIAIVHDINESITGDIDYRLIVRNIISKEEKKKSEMEAILKLKGLIGGSMGEDIYGLWKEYEDAATKEARFIKALDKLETLTYLAELGSEVIDMPDMIAKYADSAVKNFPALTGMLDAVKKKLKDLFEKRDIPWKKEYDALG